MSAFVTCGLSPVAAACIRSGAGMFKVKLPIAPVCVRLDTVTVLGLGKVNGFMYVTLTKAFAGNALPVSVMALPAGPDVGATVNDAITVKGMSVTATAVVAPSKALTKYVPPAMFDGIDPLTHMLTPLAPSVQEPEKVPVVSVTVEGVAL